MLAEYSSGDTAFVEPSTATSTCARALGSWKATMPLPNSVCGCSVRVQSSGALIEKRPCGSLNGTRLVVPVVAPAGGGVGVAPAGFAAAVAAGGGVGVAAAAAAAGVPAGTGAVATTIVRCCAAAGAAVASGGGVRQ